MTEQRSKSGGRRRAHWIPRLLILVVMVAALAGAGGCSESDEDAAADPATGSDWDQMSWG